MRTTITIDDETAAALMSSIGTDSLPKAIRAAIKFYMARRKKEKLLSLFGTLEMDVDADQLRDSWDRGGENIS